MFRIPRLQTKATIFTCLPESEDTKVLVFVNGGWPSGDKANMNGFMDFVIQQLPELAIVNMNYRLADKNNFPYRMQTVDVTTVINTLVKGSPQYYFMAAKPIWSLFHRVALASKLTDLGIEHEFTFYKTEGHA